MRRHGGLIKLDSLNSGKECGGNCKRKAEWGEKSWSRKLSPKLQPHQMPRRRATSNHIYFSIEALPHQAWPHQWHPTRNALANRCLAGQLIAWMGRPIMWSCQRQVGTFLSSTSRFKEVHEAAAYYIHKLWGSEHPDAPHAKIHMLPLQRCDMTRLRILKLMGRV